jgi:hypothetical protein
MPYLELNVLLSELLLVPLRILMKLRQVCTKAAAYELD